MHCGRLNSFWVLMEARTNEQRIHVAFWVAVGILYFSKAKFEKGLLYFLGKDFFYADIFGL